MAVQALTKQVTFVLSAVTLAVLCILFIKNFFYESRSNTIDIIVRDLATLRTTFEAIDKTCGIINFDYQKNSINFLNVISFAGSEVGSMNVRYPKNWQGPYVKDNPTVQSKEYQVVQTVKGYFITPGDGVKLPNGKTIGTDIKLDKDADIASMMHQEGVLLFDNQSLAIPLVLQGYTEYVK